ncbi:hypothetical protein [Bradyrhizobium retamae]|uniref:Pilus assembly protein PilZ n=1 Tax=Bradyrhizobium retamae TaxID=1300035 RepID=A0A0R3MEE4_9BRAD|nr:hypothetical protein [Bradyrhizobium retamae]KRR18648.1 hypothetical protein CQ13_34655 [Bradyrhizobium retamae]
MDAREDNRPDRRVRFEHGVPAHLTAIDGTWRRDCTINDVSEVDATLTVNESIEGLNLRELFLLLSSTGLAYRHCSLAWVNGDQIGATFLRPKRRKKPPDRPAAIPKGLFSSMPLHQTWPDLA